MFVFFALGNAKVLSFALDDAKVPNPNVFASQWNIGFRIQLRIILPVHGLEDGIYNYSYIHPGGGGGGLRHEWVCNFTPLYVTFTWMPSHVPTPDLTPQSLILPQITYNRDRSLNRGRGAYKMGKS